MDAAEVGFDFIARTTFSTWRVAPRYSPEVEGTPLARKALDTARSGGTGFADHLTAQVFLAAGLEEILTFDKAFARHPRVRRLH